MWKRNRLRFFRNLLLAAGLCFLFWALQGFPLPKGELDMRREERRHIAERSEIVWSYDQQGLYRRLLLIAGITPDAVHVYDGSYAGGSLAVYPRREGGTLVLLLGTAVFQQSGKATAAPAFLVADPPPGTVSARLTIEVGPETYAVDAPLRGRTLFFQLQPKYPMPEEAPSGEEEALYETEQRAFTSLNADFTEFPNEYPYTLEYFGPAGVPIGTAVGWPSYAYEEAAP